MTNATQPIEPGLIFRTKMDRGFYAEAWEGEGGNATIKVWKVTMTDHPEKIEQVVREFSFPAYKVWNIAAHFSDIVDSEIEKNGAGYMAAGSTGFGNVLDSTDLGSNKQEER